ncbi:hypothetical protein M9H77_08309 [Catharanthus roseus]|uniref:Uncharacterized protein n=1 Tax=Catharanthus roseus TaxID=4058 RepID=A0ACC0BXD0_CATRO|nr:hypothetical protein M9H77_08309 [Catharanthus roseus]
MLEDDVSIVSTAFDEHMKWLFEHNHLAYIPFQTMMPLIKAAMSVDSSISSWTAAATGSFEVPTRDSSIPSPSIHAPGPTSLLSNPTDVPTKNSSVVYIDGDY